MSTAQARLVVISPVELANGFRLAGAFTMESDSSDEAEHVIGQLLRDGERGVIAVYAPLFEGFNVDLKRKLRASVAPVVVELPTGLRVEGEDVRRARLAERLQNAIGYHVTFSEDQE